MSTEWVKFKGEIFDLGIYNKSLEGIYSTLQDQATVSKYIHEQFTSKADDYVRDYENLDHYKWLLNIALDKIKIRPQTILDIGSGSGNTVLPLLEIFPDSKIIASDLSLELLQRIRNRTRDKKNLAILQMNAEELNFNDKVFDLVSGGSILHHLFKPEIVIKNCAAIVADGGYVIFYEPFESGYLIIRDILNSILSDDRHSLIDNKIIKLFKAIVIDIEARLGEDKSDKRFQYMDDKWLFSKKYFQDAATFYGFESCLIYSTIEIDESLFRKKIAWFLTLVSMDANLPDWSWNIIKKYDDRFSLEEKEELLMEGCIIIKK